MNGKGDPTVPVAETAAGESRTRARRAAGEDASEKGKAEAGAGEGGRTRDLVELSVGYGLILLACWVPNPVERVLFWVAFAWIAGVSLAARRYWGQMGLRLAGSLRSLWVAAVALLFSGASFWIAARLHTLHGMHRGQPLSRAWGYLVWALLQQFILQDLVLLRLLRLLPTKRGAVAAAAALFAIVHLPNPLLTAVTLVWGTLACLLFLRYRGLFVLGLVHGILGLTVAFTVPDAVHHHMRVGIGYLTYRPHRPRRKGSHPNRLPPQAATGLESEFLAQFSCCHDSHDPNDGCLCSFSGEKTALRPLASGYTYSGHT